MAGTAKQNGGNSDHFLRLIFWSAAAAALLAPLVAMRFTNEVQWDGADFIFAGVLIGIVGIAFELTMRMTHSWSYRFGIGSATAAAFFIVWVNAAVGMIGDGSNIYTLLFLGVVVLALVGAILARFRAAGMALAMAAAGIAHIAVAIAGSSIDPRGAILSAAFGGLWALSAALFHMATRKERSL